MGLDLTICPDKWGKPAQLGILAHTRIDFAQDYALFGAIMQLDPTVLPDDIEFQWYDDEGLERRRLDPYGQPLTYVTAGQLSSLATEPVWNRAVMQFVRALPPETTIVLYWH